MTNDKMIEHLIEQCCDKMLNDYYLEICLQVKDDYLALLPEGMNRGKPEVWAASIIWAVGSINFLSDKTFPPYATLTDICTFFKTKNSTVGNKAGQIREILDMHYLNINYLLEDSSIISTLTSMRVTENGFIVLDPQDALDIGYIEDDGQIIDHIIIGKSEKPILLNTFYQYEFKLEQIMKTWIKNDGRERTIHVSMGEDINELLIRVTCSKTEAMELKHWMQQHRFLVD